MMKFHDYSFRCLDSRIQFSINVSQLSINLKRNFVKIPAPYTGLFGEDSRIQERFKREAKRFDTTTEFRDIKKKVVT